MSGSRVGRIIQVTFGMLLCVVSLTGCQKAEGEVHEPVTILTGQQNYSAFAELMNERYPEVNLEFISYCGGDCSRYMQESLEQGEIPDIYTVTFFPDEQLQKEQLLDLSNYSVVNEYASTMLDNMNVDGGIYLLPSQFALLGMVYNKTLMAENGWEVPESFEELKALAPEIEAAGYRVCDMNTSLTGNTFGAFFALGNTLFFKTPEGSQWKDDFLKGTAEATGSLEEVAAYYQEWIDAGFISTYYYDNPDESASSDFNTRKYVFQMYSNRVTGSKTSDEYGFMPILSRDGTDNMLVRLISRYYGLNKELAEPGNEQKLEDALKVFELMASQEGQEALAGNSNSLVPFSSANNLPESSPYYEVLDLINSGKMVDMVYSGWEDHIVPLIEGYGNLWIDGEISAAEFLEGMDTLNKQLLEGANIQVYGTAPEPISIEDTARLCAIAEGKAVDADAALVAMPGFHGFLNGANQENRYGVHAGIFQGEIDQRCLAVFAPGTGKILTVKLTGSEIQALVKEGFSIEGDPEPYEYCLVTKGDMELEADREYTLAVGSDELTNMGILQKAEDTGITPKQAVIDYIMEKETITAASIVWE